MTSLFWKWDKLFRPLHNLMIFLDRYQKSIDEYFRALVLFPSHRFGKQMMNDPMWGCVFSSMRVYLLFYFTVSIFCFRCWNYFVQCIGVIVPYRSIIAEAKRRMFQGIVPSLSDSVFYCFPSLRLSNELFADALSLVLPTSDAWTTIFNALFCPHFISTRNP